VIRSVVGRIRHSAGLAQNNSIEPFASLAAAIILILILCFFFEPFWETNDDVGMSMVVHGYGPVSTPSPNLIFSNVIWGFLTGAIPTLGGIMGYSLATMIVLVVVGAILCYCLIRFGIGIIGSLFLLVLVVVRPVLFPQFTINAGLLMVAAVFCLALYERDKDARLLVLGCLAAWCSYLVRSSEFLVTLFVAIPLLPWRILRTDRWLQIACVITLSAIAVSEVLDWQAYQMDEWKAFKMLDSVRVSFTDFGAGAHLKQNPEILAKHGYSPNDVDLITNWYFIDPNIANPVALRSMLDEIGPLPEQKNALTRIWTGVRALWHVNLLPLSLAALALLMLRPGWRLAGTWGLCLAVIMAMGLMGRPGILRVYMPLVALLLIAPFLQGPMRGWRQTLTVGGLLLAATFQSLLAFSDSQAYQDKANQIQQGLTGFPETPVVVWGDAFPYEAVYPVLEVSSAAMKYRLFGLDAYTLAPFYKNITGQMVVRSMTDTLLSKDGLAMIASQKRFNYLEIYCREHFHGRLTELFAVRYGEVVISRRRCEKVP